MSQAGPLGLQRTDVTTFLNSVGTELRLAADFLNKDRPLPVKPPPGSPSRQSANPPGVKDPVDCEPAPCNAAHCVLEPEVAALSPRQAAQMVYTEAALEAEAWQAEGAICGRMRPEAGNPGAARELTTAAAVAAGRQQHRSVAKVASWLSTSSDAAWTSGGCAPCSRISGLSTCGTASPACPEAVQLATQRGRSPSLQQQRQQQRQQCPPAAYVASPAWPQRKLVLARPLCHDCGRPGMHCCCQARQPLRLLRAKHPGYPSGKSSAREERIARQAAPQTGGKSHEQQGAAISIGSIHTAHFGGLQAGSTPQAWGPARANGSSRCLVDMQPTCRTGWAAPVEDRARHVAAGWEARRLQTGTGSSSSVVDQLRAISSRIRALQGGIAGFLSGQRPCDPPLSIPRHAAAARSRAGGMLCHAGGSMVAMQRSQGAVETPLIPAPIMVAVSAAAPGHAQAELVTMGPSLTMRLGADAQPTGAAASVQPVAVRVGRQVRLGRRAPSVCV